MHNELLSKILLKQSINNNSNLEGGEDGLSTISNILDARLS